MLALAGSVVVAAAQAPAAHAAGSTLSNETFTGAAVPDDKWIGLGDACLTAAGTGSAAATGNSNLGGCTRTTDSPTTLGSGSDGYLQLTDNSSGRTGAVVYDRAFPNTAGLQVSFDEYQYASSGMGLGAADGIGFFLTDGSYTLTKPGPQGGGYGGALGYASIAGQPGVDHGYLGVGLDVYGNYEAQPYVGTSCPTANGNTAQPNSVGLRGPGDGTDGYCLLGSTPYASLQNAPATAPGGAKGTTQLVTVTVSPTSADDPYPTITVTINGTTVLSKKMTTPAPPTLKMGFTASTGLGHEVHLIRQVSVNSVTPLGAISLVKTVDHTDATGTAQTVFTEGDRVPYSFLVTNTGAETLNNIVVTDPKITDVSCPASSLPPAAAMSCTGTYGPLTAADAAGGSFTNTATVSGSTPEGSPVTDRSSAVIPTYQSAQLSITKRITGDSPAAVPDGREFAIDYSYPAGDYQPASTAPDGNPNGYPAGSGTLTVHANGTTTSTGRIPTGARVTLREESPAAIPGYAWGTPVFSQNPVTVGGSGTTAVVLSNPLNTTSHPALTILKSATPNTTAAYQAGQLVSYSFAVTNTGNVPLTDVTVTDARFTGTGALSAIDCPTGIHAMAPGDTVTCTAQYRLTQADIDAGHVDNIATATGAPPTGPQVEAPPSGTRVPVQATPGITLVKTASPTTVSAVGQTVTYSFLATNTGNVTLDHVRVVEDRFTGSGTLSDVDCPVAALAPGGIELCTASYTVTQADLDAEAIDNTATAYGTPPDAGPVSSTPSSAQVTAPATPDPHTHSGTTGTGQDTVGGSDSDGGIAPSTGVSDAVGPRVNTGGRLVARHPLWWPLLGAPLIGSVIAGTLMSRRNRRRS